MPYPMELFIGSQDWLIDRMQMSGYRGDRAGVCTGVAHMAKYAVLAKHATKFYLRFNKIEKIPIAEFANVSKVNKFFKTEVHPLFNGIELYQNPQFHEDYFSELSIFGDENDSKVCELTRPDILEEIVNPVGFGGIYTQEELIYFFHMLQTALEKANCKHPVAFLLKNVDHVITLGYNPEKKKSRWQLFDANQLSNKRLKTSAKIAKDVFSIFPESGYAVFSTQIHVEAKAAPSIYECYLFLVEQEKWQKIHNVKEKLQFKWLNHGRVLALAIMSRPDFIEPLLQVISSLDDKEKLGYILTTRFRNNWSILIGAIFYYPAVAQVILELISSLDNEEIKTAIFAASTNDGWTALLHALYHQTQLVEPLLNCILKLGNESRELIIMRNFECDPSALIWTLKFQPSCAEALLDAVFSLENKDAIDFILRQCDDTGCDVLICAIKGGYVSIVKKLLTKINRDMLLENQPLIMFLAALYGNAPIIKLLLAYGLNRDCPFDISLLSYPQFTWILRELENQTHKPPSQPKEKKFIFPYQLAGALGHEEACEVLCPPFAIPQATDEGDMSSLKRSALERRAQHLGFFQPESDKTPQVEIVFTGYTA